ncbi:toxin-antitoxin system YwqK family antitoxin [Chloroflexota bacterium]
MLEEELTEEEQETVKEFLFDKWELVRVETIENPQGKPPLEEISIEQQVEFFREESQCGDQASWYVSLYYERDCAVHLAIDAPYCIYAGDESVFVVSLMQRNVVSDPGAPINESDVVAARVLSRPLGQPRLMHYVGDGVDRREAEEINFPPLWREGRPDAFFKSDWAVVWCCDESEPPYRFLTGPETAFIFDCPEEGLRKTFTVSMMVDARGLPSKFTPLDFVYQLKEEEEEEPEEEEVVEEEGLVCEKEYWDSTGKLGLEYCNLNGKFHGAYKKYRSNGVIEEVTNYNHGVRDGLHTKHDENGNKSSETHWVNGKKDGPQRYYFESGQIKSERHYVNNVLHGTEMVYCDTDGYTIWKEIEWLNGEKVDEETYDTPCGIRGAKTTEY